MILSKLIGRYYVKSFLKQLEDIVVRGGGINNHVIDRDTGVLLNKDVTTIATRKIDAHNEISKYVLEKIDQTVQNDLQSMKGQDNYKDNYVTLVICASVLHAAEALEVWQQQKHHVHALASKQDDDTTTTSSSTADDQQKLIDVGPQQVVPPPQLLISQAMVDIPFNKYYMETMLPKMIGYFGKDANEQMDNLLHPKLITFMRHKAFNNFIDLQSTRNKQIKTNKMNDGPDNGTLGTNDMIPQNAFIVNRCGFYDFFHRHKRPDLVTSICAVDTKWMEAMNQSTSCHVKCRRPCTISTGGKRCVFQFVPKASNHDDETSTATTGGSYTYPASNVVEDVVMESLTRSKA